jgi:hypothetical protein
LTIGHNAWLKCGFDGGVCMLAGSLQPNPGESVLVQNTSLIDLQSRLKDDPFV